MDHSFIRNQIELKLSELQSLINLYADGVENDLSVFKSILSEKEKAENSKLIDDLKSYSENASEMQVEFLLTVSQLTVLYGEYYKVYKSKIEEQKKNLTATFEGITIEREFLHHSDLASSAGYNKENLIMDIEFNSGKIYRYYNVPFDFYEKIISRSGFKGARKELNEYEFKQIK